MINPFELFGVTIDSNIVELRKSYYSLALLCHPDKGGDEDSMIQLVNAYNYVKKNLEHKSNKTYEEAEKEFELFVKEQNELPYPSIDEITNELFDRNLEMDKESEYNCIGLNIFRDSGYSHLMESSENVREDVPSQPQNKFSKEIMIYQEPQNAPYYLDNKLDLTLKQVKDFSTKNMCDYYQAFCEPDKIENKIVFDVNEAYERLLHERALP